LDSPFDSIEGAQEYLKLLSEAVGEAKTAVTLEVVAPVHPGHGRRSEALRLVVYKLEKLEQHVTAGRRILNDLRILRRLLMEERTDVKALGEDAPKSLAEALEMEAGFSYERMTS
jgi:hypothetical protein